MTGTLYIAVQLFSPSLVRPAQAPDDYSHDDGALHLILQPMLLQPVEGAGDMGINTLSIADYFKDWEDFDPKRSAPVLIGRTISDAIERRKVRAVPVPFPPNFKISLDITLSSQGGETTRFHDLRLIGQTTPIGASVTALDQLSVSAADGWPKMAELSNAIPLVRSYGELEEPDGQRQETVRRWLIGLFNTMNETASNSPEWRRNTVLDGIWTSDVGARLANGLPLSDVSEWDDWLQSTQAGSDIVAGRLYDTLLATYASIPVTEPSKDPVLAMRPVRFSYRPGELAGKSFLFDAGLAIAGRSYLHSLWHELRRLVTETPSAAEQALGRYFGFGERLAWPKGKLDGTLATSQRYMVLQPTLGVDAAWFVTNGISLAGQVFRLISLPSAPSITVDVSDFRAGHGSVADDQLGEVAVFPTSEGPAKDLLAYAIQQAHASIMKTPAGREIAVEAKWDTSYARGSLGDNSKIVHWHLRTADLLTVVPPAVPAPSKGKTWYTLPPSLLDVVDDAARTTPTAGLRATPQPPRRGLQAADLIDGGAFAVDTELKLRLPATLRPFRTGEVVKGSHEPFRAYQLELDELHPSDAAAQDWLMAVAAGTRTLKSWMWIPQGLRNEPFVYDLDAHKMVSASDGAVSIVLFDDPAPSGATGPISLALNKTPEGGARIDVEHPWPVDLVFEIQTGEPFNLISASSPPRELTLKSGFVSRLGMSSDRIAQSLALTWAPGFEPDKADNDFQISTAADFNKLRITMDGFPGTTGLPLSDPGSLLPVARYEDLGTGLSPEFLKPYQVRGPVAKDGPHAWYWPAYHLDQDLDASNDLEETFRYHAWTGASQDKSLSAYVEHQTGHRIPVRAPAVRMRRSIDIVHPAFVHIRGLLHSEQKVLSKRRTGIEDRTDAPRRPLLLFTCDTDGIFSVSLQRKAVRLAIERFRGGGDEDPSGRGHGADGGRRGSIRQIYMTLTEVRDALRHPDPDRKPRLIIQGWRFDATSRRAAAGSIDLGLPETQIVPDILGVLQPWSYALSVLLAEPAPASSLAKVFDALDKGSLKDFVDALDTAVPHDVNMDQDPSKDGPWPATEPLASEKAPYLVRNAHFVSADLKLERPGDFVAETDWASAVFVPLFDPQKFSKSAEVELAAGARRDLATLLQPPTPDYVPSRLWLSIAALETTRIDKVQKKTDGNGRGVELGEYAERLLWPEGRVDGQDQLLEAFYVPFGFLVPPAHPGLRDRQGTADFTQWLLELLSMLASGASTDAYLKISYRSAVPTAGELVNLRQRAIRLLGGDFERGRTTGVVGRLETLLERVEKKVADGGSAREKELFNHVSLLIEELEIAGEWPKVRREMLRRRPELFGLSKGIAVGVFNAPFGGANFAFNGYHSDLYALEVKKIVFRDQDPNRLDLDLRPFENERFDFTRIHYGYPSPFFVDVLPEATYDDIFTIRQNRYSDVASDDFDALGEPRYRSDILRLADGHLARGDVLAWSAEDIVQNHTAGSRFDFRDLEIDIVHYNPDWRTKRDDIRRQRGAPEFFYLLPERRLPDTPKVLAKVHANLSDPPLRSSKMQLHDPSETNDLAAAWTQGALSLFDAIDTIHVPGGEGDRKRIYARVKQDTRNRPRAIAPPPHNWQLLTRHCSHHWFQINLQRPSEALKTNLEDDVYEIDIEFWDHTPPSSPSITEIDESTEPLLDWYNFQRLQNRGEVGKMPVEVEANYLISSLERWLIEAPGTAPHFGKTLLRRPAPVEKQTSQSPALTRSYRLSPPLPMSRDEWEVVPISQTPDGIGEWASFEIYAPVDGDGKPVGYEDKPEGFLNDSVVLRFSISDHPFQVSRVRVRAIRNALDINGDHLTDLNPDFILAEPASAWSSGREFLTVDEADLKRLNVPAEKGGALFVVPAISGKDWLQGWSKGLDPKLAPDVAAALSACFRVQYEDLAGTFDLWDHARLLGIHNVSGQVFQNYPDNMPRYGLQGVADVGSTSARNHADVRQIIPLMPASNLETYLAENLRPELVNSIAPSFDLTWMDLDNIPVFRTVLTMRVKTT